MKDIADKVDRVKDLIAERHGKGERYGRTIEEEQITADFIGELVANSRRIATALETAVEKGIPITVPTETHQQVTQLAWEAGQNFEFGRRAAGN